MDIVGIGSIAVDRMIQVDNLPVEDGFSFVLGTKLLPGGSGANVIVQAQRLSAQCGFIAQLGDDENGGAVLESFRKEGVDTRAMLVKKGGVTIYTDIVVDRSGKKFILLNMGDSLLTLDEKDVDFDRLLSARILYTDMIPGEVCRSALRRAHEAGIITAFNMQVDLHQMGSCGTNRDELLGALRDVDLFAPCRLGFEQLTGTSDVEAGAAMIRKYFDGTLLLTQGSRGSVVFDAEGGKYFCPIFPARVKDTTGAGDSYMGAFLYAHYLKAANILDAMYFATGCAAFTCTGVGARSSPTLAQVEAFMGQKRP